MLKFVTIALAGVLTAVTVKRLFDQFQAQKARVKASAAPATPAVTKLRQDPRTGIYYPEQ
jgi:hypothetical protein